MRNLPGLARPRLAMGFGLSEAAATLLRVRVVLMLIEDLSLSRDARALPEKAVRGLLWNG